MDKSIIGIVLGFGLGALVFTQRGRQIVNAMGQTPIVKNIGDQAMQFLKNMPQGANNAKNEISGGGQSN